MRKYEFTVNAIPYYLAEQSAPDEDQYVFAYKVTIRNTGDVAGQLISTPVGSMRGSYQCVAADGTEFEAPIPEFVLSMPNRLH